MATYPPTHFSLSLSLSLSLSVSPYYLYENAVVSSLTLEQPLFLDFLQFVDFLDFLDFLNFASPATFRLMRKSWKV